MRIVIANGSKQASFIISMFKSKENQLTVINSSRSFANELVHKEHIPVLVGSPWRKFVLEEANVHDADVFISLSEKDTDNYASCILAKRVFNVKKCICVVNNPENVELYKKLGIDSVISSTYLLAQSIKSESSMESLMKTLTLENNKIVVLEIPVLSKYRIANKRIMVQRWKSGTILIGKIGLARSKKNTPNKKGRIKAFISAAFRWAGF